MHNQLPRDHPHVIRVASWIQKYDSGELDSDGLQQNLYAIWTALEADLPTSFRQAVRQTQALLEVSVYSRGPCGMSVEAKDALEELRRQIDTAM